MNIPMIAYLEPDVFVYLVIEKSSGSLGMYHACIKQGGLEAAILGRDSTTQKRTVEPS